jgi:hypothetical protein
MCDSHLAYYLVLFVDVLGQREQLRKLTKLPSSPEENEATDEILRETAGAVRLLRHLHERIFSGWLSGLKEVQGLPEPVRIKVLQDLDAKVLYHSFSDCIAVSVCLANEGNDHLKAMNGVLSTLVAGCALPYLCLAAGKTIRGGADVGIAMPIGPNEIYGSALERAVQLESVVAQYPRIVVGKQLQDYLLVMASQPTPSPQAIIATSLARTAQRLLFTDDDGEIALDYLGAEMKQYHTEEHDNELLPKAYEYVRSEKQRWEAINENKLASRYNRLWSYLQSRAHLWGSEIEALSSKTEGG